MTWSSEPIAYVFPAVAALWLLHSIYKSIKATPSTKRDQYYVLLSGTFLLICVRDVIEFRGTTLLLIRVVSLALLLAVLLYGNKLQSNGQWQSSREPH